MNKLLFFAALVIAVSSFAVTINSKTLPPINIVQITDVHGWIFGHPHEPTLNADFGDFASLLEWLQIKAKAAGEEFFVFDSGDLIEGTGLSDATEVHGYYIFEAYKMVKNLNALTLGNHDIGHPADIDLINQSFIPFWKGTLLTSNTMLKSTGKTLGSPFYSFTTELGTNVLVLGYLYNFTQEANNTNVVPVATSLAEPYFSQAMSIPNIDMIVVVAHIDPTEPLLLRQIYNAIRASHPTTPLVLLSGHRHITYYEKYDDSAFTLESGKYFEVLGNMRFTVNPTTNNIENFFYEFVNATKDNFYQWSGKSESSFLTPQGATVRKYINTAFNALNLNQTQGCSPIHYNSSESVSHGNSLYNLYIEHAIPKAVFNYSFNENPFFITNSATLRYDLYQGRVNLNDVYTILPFKDNFYYYLLRGDELKKALYALNHDSISAHPYYHDRVPYFSKDMQGVKDWGPQFYYSYITIDDNTKYAVVVAEYDAYMLGLALEKVYPNRPWQKSQYPTDTNSTFALLKYINQYMTCSSSCIC